MDEYSSMRLRTRRGTVAQSEVPVSVPNLDEFGHREFTYENLQSLAQDLRASQWPSGTLNIFALEGLLTALLVLPLGLRPGAWLPLVWNGSGWRVPPILRDAARFSSFIELLLGFMRTIDQGLLASPPRFSSLLDALGRDPQSAAYLARQDWARGFGMALSACDHIKVPSGSCVHRALCSIAAHSHAPVTSRHGYLSLPSIQQTVLLLASARTSRGPLGQLSKVKPPQRNSPPQTA